MEKEVNWKKERIQFDHAANYYDLYRPSYPKEIIDKILSFGKINPKSKILEIGSGSGKATELFCGKNLNILCVDPGKNLIDIGNKRFSDEHFHFVEGYFEGMDFNNEAFDLIMSFQAFHWIKQPEGFIKCSNLLKDEGTLALVWNMYLVKNEVDRKLVDLSQIYVPFEDFLFVDEVNPRIEIMTHQIEENGLFSKPEVFLIEWQKDYSADEYFNFCLTGNRFIQIGDETKLKAKKDINQLTGKNNSVLTRTYLCALYICHKK